MALLVQRLVSAITLRSATAASPSVCGSPTTPTREERQTWMFRIALNCSNTRLRQRGRHLANRVDDSESELERAADEGRSPEERAVATDLSAAVRIGLDHLPFHYREAVLLRDFEDMNYSEIAAVLGVRIGTVRSRIARGREQLRKWLKGNV